MPIIRLEKHTDRFSILNNTCLNDSRLSLKAVGLWAFLMSKPDSWKVNVESLARFHADGEHAVRMALLELEAMGYAELVVSRDESGRFSEKSWVIYEEPCPERARRGLARQKGLQGDKPEDCTGALAGQNGTIYEHLPRNQGSGSNDRPESAAENNTNGRGEPQKRASGRKDDVPAHQKEASNAKGVDLAPQKGASNHHDVIFTSRQGGEPTTRKEASNHHDAIFTSRPESRKGASNHHDVIFTSWPPLYIPPNKEYSYISLARTDLSRTENTLNLIAETCVSAGGQGGQASKSENGSRPSQTSAPPLTDEGKPKKERRRKAKAEVQKEYWEAIADAWTDINRLPDGTNPLTSTDYKILRVSVERLYKDGVPVSDVIKAIHDLAELRRAGEEWARRATPNALPGLISRSRLGLLTAQKKGRLSQYEYAYDPAADWRRRER